jgi:hypothetical protein
MKNTAEFPFGLKPWNVTGLIERLKMWDEYIEWQYMHGDCKKMQSGIENREIVIGRLINNEVLP